MQIVKRGSERGVTTLGEDNIKLLPKSTVLDVVRIFCSSIAYGIIFLCVLFLNYLNLKTSSKVCFYINIDLF